MKTSDNVRLPGLVDVQVNGHLGVDFSSPTLTEDDFIGACMDLKLRGTVALLATLISAPPAVLRRNVTIIVRSMRVKEIASMVLGLHIEGPFLDPADGSRGAHRPENIVAPRIDLFDRIRQWCSGHLRLVTVAPGLPGVDALIRHAASKGVVVSLGHHNASLEAIRSAVDAGAHWQTHLGNGIANSLDRTNNAIFHVLSLDSISAMIITDGHHIPESFIRTVWRVKGPQRTIIVSDQSSVAGLPPGEYETLGNTARLEANGRLHNPEAGHLVGSAMTLVECASYFTSLGVASPAEIARVAFENPLRLVGMTPEAIEGPDRVVISSDGVEVTA